MKRLHFLICGPLALGSVACGGNEPQSEGSVDAGGASAASGDASTTSTGTGSPSTSGSGDGSGGDGSGAAGSTTDEGSSSNTVTSTGGASTSGSTDGEAGSGGTGGAGDVTSTDGGTGAVGGGGGGSWVPAFDTRVLSPDHYAEGAAVADIDGDGVVDLIAGPLWYRGPEFELGGELYDAPTFTTDQYSLFFLTFADDVNSDGYVDVIAVGDAGGGNGTGTPNAHWYENPGPENLDQVWEKHPIFDGLVANESPAYLDLLGDENEELVFMTDGALGYAVPGSDPTAPWTFTPVSGDQFNTPYVHGLGVGDVNSDGRNDIVEGTGWWEQPETLGGMWTHHAAEFNQGQRGGAQMLVYDVDGDQDADVVTSLNAHGYGLSWFEQGDDGSFTNHEILPPMAGGDSFSQLHSLGAGDLNGDGLLDVVSGKRYYAHPSTNPDPGTTDPAVLYWFELDESATFTPHLIHDESGAGCNFTIFDVNGDGRLDIFTANKHGIFLHTQQ